MTDLAECPECDGDEWHLLLEEDDICGVKCVGCGNVVEIEIHNWVH